MSKENRGNKVSEELDYKGSYGSFTEEIQLPEDGEYDLSDTKKYSASFLSPDKMK